MNYAKQFAVEPGSRTKLKDIDPGSHGKHESSERAAPEIADNLHRLRELQYTLYAERAHSLLIVLQGIDAAGKDGVCRHVISAMNPQGCEGHGLQAAHARGARARFPVARSPRTHRQSGKVAIFNRSHYEDVLVVRVHELVPKEVWSGALRAHQRVRAAAGRQRHHHPEVLPVDLQGRATGAFQGSAGRSGAPMEDQRQRLHRARATGTTISRPTRTRWRTARRRARRGTSSRRTTSGSATSQCRKSSPRRWRT